MLARTGSTWWVRQRQLSGGVDRPLLSRLTPYGGAARNLAFIADRQGTTLAAVQPDGQRDNTVAYFGRNLFGRLEGASGSGTSSNAETGFTGASTPNQTGGFTYLRNRWYDPQSGRFLTQDPIGLAGGVNLYAYAGNNPVTFSDPFGLKECEERGNCTQGDGGEMEARGVAMRMSDVIVPTDASPLFLVGGLQSKAGGAAARLVGPAAKNEAKILAEFFGQRAAGAMARLESKTLTPGITSGMLEKYAETVARPIVNGTAPAGKITERALETQSARLDLIVAALKDWF